MRCRGPTRALALALTVGAPTSPSLANALCYHLDAALDSLSKRLATNYTRYADDLFFSTYEKNVLTELTIKLQ